jgi:hypothetical protein
MEWNDFKRISNINLGYKIIKQSGVVCPIGKIDDEKQLFRYVINGGAMKPIYYNWVKECINILNKYGYISNKKIRSICQADCDTSIIASILVNQLSIAQYDLPIGKSRSIGLKLL